MRVALARFSVIAALSVPVLVVHATEKGTFGVGILVRGTGFFLNPTIKSVTVMELEPEMPAAMAGVTVGDEILEIEKRTVPGAKANEIRPLLERPVGQELTFKLRRVSGEEYVVRLASVPRR